MGSWEGHKGAPMGLPPPYYTPWKARGGPIASMGLCGTLQLPYSRPTAGLPSQPLIAEDLGGEMERLGGNGELGRTQRGSMGLAPIHSAPYTDRGGPIASMSLCGVLQPSYSGPIAALQPGCRHSH